MDHKPSLFVASSVQSLAVAYAIQENLQYDAEVTVWSQGAFELSRSTLESLIEIVETMDFGVFVFGSDDVLKWKQAQFKVVRDNVLFELGLFVGKLGRERNYIIQVAGVEDFHLPTDLIGVQPAMYDPNRKDKNIKAALGPACNQIRTAIQKHGPLTRKSIKITISHESYIQAVNSMVAIEKVFKAYVVNIENGYPLLFVSDRTMSEYVAARQSIISIPGLVFIVPKFILHSLSFSSAVEYAAKAVGEHKHVIQFCHDEAEKFIEAAWTLVQQS